MSRLLINCSVFILGVMLAFVFALRGRLLSFANNSGHTRAAISVEKMSLPSSLDRSEARLLYAKQRRSLLQAEVSLEERLAILTRAMEEGTEESLQLLRKEHLRVIPDYRRKLLPRVKYAALESLFRRFSDADWRSWPVGALTSEGERTDARYFVDKVFEVNSEIGRTLETAAHLLHGMYVSISAGAPYAMKQDLQYLVLNAAEVLSARTDGVSPAEPAFDPLILKDPAVELSFEQVRMELTKQFVREHGQHLEAQLALLMDLNLEVADETVIETLRQIMHTLSLHASSQYRAELLPTIVDSKLLGELAKENRTLAKALANLYVVGVIDALDAGRSTLAKKLLMRSEATYSGLRAQKLLHRYFAGQQQNAEPDVNEADSSDAQSRPDTARLPALPSELATPKPIELAAEKTGTAVAASEPESGFSFGNIALWLLIFGVLGFLAIIVIAYNNRQTSTFDSDSLPTPYEPDTTPEESAITDPSAMGFEMDEGEPDIDFGFGDLEERAANGGEH